MISPVSEIKLLTSTSFFCAHHCIFDSGPGCRRRRRCWIPLPRATVTAAAASAPRHAIPTGWTDWEIDCGPLLFGLLAKELGIIEQTSRRQHVCECIDIYWLLLPSSCCCLAARCSLDILLPLLRRRGVPPYTIGSNPFWTCILYTYITHTDYTF